MFTVPRFALYGTEQANAWADFVHIESIPERSSRFNWEIAPHLHEGLLQLLYIVEASEGGEARIDDRRWELHPACLIIVPAGAVHAFRFRRDTNGPVITAPQRPLESLLSSFAPELLPLVRTPRVLPIGAGNRFSDGLMPLFDAIWRESSYAVAEGVSAGMSLMAALFVQISRISDSASTDVSDPRSRRAMQIEQFRQHVDCGFREHRSVDRYAKDMGVTAGHLARLCRSTLGMSPLDVINARLVHEAQRELVYSSLSVKQIAAVLGFEDEAYFGRFFKKQAGQRPTEFRKAAQAALARR